MIFSRKKKQESSKKIAVIAWSFYDWANSVYPLIITTAIFPIYYKQVTPNNIFLGSLSFSDTELYTYTSCMSFILVALCSPILSGIADYMGNRKKFMQFFTYLGAFSCIGLTFFAELNIKWGMCLILMASVGYWGSTVFYNSYLPSLIPPRRYDSISAQGYMLGYLGSCILLTLCLAWILIQGAEYTHYCFAFVGIWWIVFAQFTFWFLPNTPAIHPAKNILLKGYQELIQVWREIQHKAPETELLTSLEENKNKNKYIIPFLYGFFAYSVGIQTFLLIAALFAQKELGIPTENLISSILIIQLVGLFGALIFAKISKNFGNILALSIGLVLWTTLCFWIYFYTNKTNSLDIRIYQFYGISFVVGLIMGGTQALSRSTYSKLIPSNPKHAVSYFSFYDVTEKWSIVVGTFIWAFLEGATGDMYGGLLFISIFLFIGLVILIQIPNFIFIIPINNKK